jgi:voltage-gated potassium channel
MPLFLIANRLLKRVNRYREAGLLASAAFVILVGALLFSLTQKVSYGTAVYWAIVTATTVGYGDVTPHNTAGRIVACIVILVTIPLFGAVFASVAGRAIINHFRRILGMDRDLPASYTLILGAHPVLGRVIDELSRAGDPVVLVAPQKPADLPDHFVFLGGDPTDDSLLRRAQPSRANRALVACEADADTLVIAVALHNLAAELEVYALTQSQRVARALSELGVRHTLSADELVGHTLAKSLETPQAGDVLLQLVDSTGYRMVEAPVEAEMVAKPLSSARARSGMLVLGISRSGGVDLGLEDDPLLAAGDRLIVVQPGRA